MIDVPRLTALLQSFADAGDGQALKSCELAAMLLASTPAPFSRDQFTPGHITCTGLVLAPDGVRLLLVHHGRLGRWLAPGGHVEPEDAEIWDGARREVIEETGVRLASEGIPACWREPMSTASRRKARNRTTCIMTCLFTFRATSEEFRLSEESLAIAWCTPADFDRYAVPANLLRAYARVRELSSTR